MHNFILKVSYIMEDSTHYQKIKSFFSSLLEDATYPYKKYFDRFMIVLIIISVSILIMSKTGKIPEWMMAFDLYFVTAIFALEYLLRLWINDDIHKMIVSSSSRHGKFGVYWSIIKSKLRYMVSLPALIDLVAIFPQFRIIRLLKLYHYMHGASSLFNALVKKRFEFIFFGLYAFWCYFYFWFYILPARVWYQ
ncbi:MAG: hypothetical protein Q9M39_03100 [Sulfurovum sp.]|nr:hypothetical protein [Sulfurovum sp.]